MDPWLESRSVFADLHNSLIAMLRETLSSQLKPPYYSAIATRVYVEEGDREVEPDIENSEEAPMNTGEIRRHVIAQRFRPFVIRMADGRRISVFGQDFILISPTGRYVDVYQPDETHDILDAMFITGVSYYPATSPSETSSTTSV